MVPLEGLMKYLTIYLGKDKQAQARREALEAWAEELGLYWADKPSVGRLIQRLADEKIAAGNRNCQED